ncbi:MAG: hypothetical protein MZU95_16225 [Desulfomicrobium escambiense]|nr:hypothetical protein [Desulfomicrobium escambiense]
MTGLGAQQRRRRWHCHPDAGSGAGEPSSSSLNAGGGRPSPSSIWLDTPMRFAPRTHQAARRAQMADRVHPAATGGRTAVQRRDGWTAGSGLAETGALAAAGARGGEPVR